MVYQLVLGQSKVKMAIFTRVRSKKVSLKVKQNYNTLMVISIKVPLKEGSPMDRVK
jgi:hypothetical protein